MIVTRDASRSGAAVDLFRGPVAVDSELLCDSTDVAVFCRDGRVLGALGPGRFALSPSSAPFLGMAVTQDGSLAAAIYFVSSAPLLGIRFGGPLGTIARPGGVPVTPSIFGEATATIRDPMRLVQAVASAPDADPSVTFASYVGYAILEAARTLVTASDPHTLAADSRAFAGTVREAARPRLSALGIDLGDLASFTVTLGDEGASRAPEPAEVAYEMLWDCKFCGAKKLLGMKHRYCPSCGAPQSAEDRYFPSDADKVRAEASVRTFTVCIVAKPTARTRSAAVAAGLLSKAERTSR